MFWAQEKSPVKNDWVLQVKEDLKSLDLDYLTLENIKFLKKESFKELFENKIKQKAMESLNEEKEKRSKIKNLKYDQLNLQEYLNSPDISLRRKKLLFKIRTRMICTAENFGLKIPCKLCGLDSDNQNHLTQCIVLKLRCPELLDLNCNISTIINGQNLKETDIFLKIYEKALRTRNNILDGK